ncbi:DUF5908 family protein [Hwangdonia lutea]|uniref:DUF5908 family protein n=1 Tax=Hwangdonia lutea TaxID=3075823 RepID=A0AA97EJZ8_9FLAO|nr:DUF5908 family protein [Hwangdonia sp. SCSIO 19198]WOD42834.1 DUF5908 family protein [Hwangdonia sp. SCSIO 19198]
MPIEIKELHVKINVDNDIDKKSKTRANSTSNKEQIVAECVDQVMQIISNSKER